MQEKFESGGFTLKTYQMFFVHITPEEFKNATNTSHVGFVFEETRAGKSRDYRDVIVFENLRFQNVFCPHYNTKPLFLKNVFSSVFLTD